MYDVKSNLRAVREQLPEQVRLVAVSKFHPDEYIMAAYEEGQRIFGESHEQELKRKQESLPKDIEWHFIGHLQGKQLKYYIQFVSMIHGVDSVEHLEEVERAAAKAGRTVDVLLQAHVAQEETKFGFSPEELENLDFLDVLENLGCTRVRGLMAMASNTPDEARVREDFRRAKSLFDKLKKDVFKDNPEFNVLSMGMSHDYLMAVEEGSTLVRIGSSIFGERDYSKLRKE